MPDGEARPSGIAVVDKGAGMTSHDVVDIARKVLGERKIGHSGTLDPDATGILLLGVGGATRLLRFLTDLPKTYSADFLFGTETSTLDASGEVTATHEMSITPEQVTAATAAFLGEIEQIPPMVSAVRVDGKRLHELAREGKEVERKARKVTVYRFAMTPTDDPLVYRAEVECSSGTYIRTLAADLGTALGGGAHLTNLRRTKIGSFGEAEAKPVEDLVVLPAKEGLRDYPQTTVDEDNAFLVSNGRVLDPDQLGGVTGPGPWAVSDEAGNLLAVYERVSQHRVKPTIVLGH